MRILMTNMTLWGLAGSETATYTIAMQLKRMGHDVSVFAIVHGEFVEKLKKNGINCYNKRTLPMCLKIDIIHAHHNGPTRFVAEKYPNVPMVYVSHGIVWGVDKPEKPPFEIAQIKKLVGVSEEVVRKINGVGYDACVIRNGIDMERFYPRSEISETLKRILVIGNYLHVNHPLMRNICDAAKSQGVVVDAIGKRFGKQTWDTEKVINDADLIMGYGRCALEAMSCGRPVIVCGHNGCDGIIDEYSYEEIKKNNFSGRRYKKRWTVADLENEMEKYRKELGSISRHIVNTFHDIKRTAIDFEALYTEVLA